MGQVGTRCRTATIALERQETSWGVGGGELKCSPKPHSTEVAELGLELRSSGSYLSVSCRWLVGRLLKSGPEHPAPACGLVHTFPSSPTRGLPRPVASLKLPPAGGGEVPVPISQIGRRSQGWGTAGDQQAQEWESLDAGRGPRGVLTEPGHAQTRTQNFERVSALTKATRLVRGGHGTGTHVPSPESLPHLPHDSPDSPRLCERGLLSARGTRAKAASSEMKVCSASCVQTQVWAGHPLPCSAPNSAHRKEGRRPQRAGEDTQKHPGRAGAGQR